MNTSSPSEDTASLEAMERDIEPLWLLLGGSITHKELISLISTILFYMERHFSMKKRMEDGCIFSVLFYSLASLTSNVGEQKLREESTRLAALFNESEPRATKIISSLRKFAKTLETLPVPADIRGEQSPVSSLSSRSRRGSRPGNGQHTPVRAQAHTPWYDRLSVDLNSLVTVPRTVSSEQEGSSETAGEDSAGTHGAEWV